MPLRIAALLLAMVGRDVCKAALPFVRRATSSGCLFNLPEDLLIFVVRNRLP
jgi:hypothetical protein